MKEKERFNELQKFADELDKCTECGYCTFWCPIYQEEPEESSVARGKLQMLKALLTGERDYSKEFAESASESAKTLGSRLKDEDVKDKFRDVGKAAENFGKSIADCFKGSKK